MSSHNNTQQPPQQHDGHRQHLSDNDSEIPTQSAGYTTDFRQLQRSARTPQQVLGLQGAIGNRATARMVSAAQPIQRKAYIGTSYTEYVAQENDPQPVKALANDDTTRRFDTTQELRDFAGGRTDRMGLLPGTKTWIHLDDRLHVIGENHGTPASALIRAVNTNRFRYEGFAHSSKTRAGKDDKFATHNATRNRSRIEAHSLSDEQAAGDHSAEHILPKTARVLADVKALVVRQRTKPTEAIHDQSIQPGAALDDGYSLAKALIGGFIDGLIYTRSYGNKFFSHPLKAVYTANQAAIDTSIATLQQNDRDKVVPDYTALPAAADSVLDALIKAFTDAAIDKLGGKRKTDAFTTQMKDAALQKRVGNVTLGDAAKELDYLRDMSMYQYIQKAKSARNLLFFIGGAHLTKLEDVVATNLGVIAMQQDDFLKREEMRNFAASNGYTLDEATYRDELINAAADSRKEQQFHGDTSRFKKVGDRLKLAKRDGCTWQVTGADYNSETGMCTATAPDVTAELLFKGEAVVKKSWKLRAP